MTDDTEVRFTRADVWRLRATAQWERVHHGRMEDVAAWNDLADRIEALLPPKPEDA